jgi:hypothetical protein
VVQVTSLETEPVRNRSGEVDTHLPNHALRAAERRTNAEAPNSGLGELPRPADVAWVTGDSADARQGVHPFGQIVEVLPIPVPFELLVERLAGSALAQRLADP